MRSNFPSSGNEPIFHGWLRRHYATQILYSLLDDVVSHFRCQAPGAVSREDAPEDGMSRRTCELFFEMRAETTTKSATRLRRERC